MVPDALSRAPAESIGHHGFYPRSVSDVQVVHLEFIDPPREPCRRVLNRVHVFQGLVVCKYRNTVTVVKISVPAKQRLLDGEKFLLVNRISDLGVAELPAFVCDGMKLAVLCLLQEATSDCEI